MEHLALNVYRWGEAAQDRTVVVLATTVRELSAAGIVRRFFFTRYDARGPHLAAYFGVAPGRAPEASHALGAALHAHLAADPCTVVLAPKDLAERHRACRGFELSSIDGEPGGAENNSFLIAAHPAGGFLSGETRAVVAEAELWELLTGAALWAAARVERGEAATASSYWIAAVDRALHRAGAPAADWWRRTLLTLLPGLAERFRDGDEEFVASIPRILGEKNVGALERAWAGAESAPFRWSGVGRLVACIAAAEDGRTPLERFRLFRLVNHSILAQLGRPVSLRVPPVLFAWHRAHA